MIFTTRLLTLTAAAAFPLLAVSVNLTPSSTTLRVGETKTFNYTTSGAPSGFKLRWSVNGTAGGNTTVGTISTAGLYKTPAKPYGTDGKVTVKLEVLNAAATSVLTSDSSTVTVLNPTVTVTSISPAIIGPAPFTLNIYGSGFVADSTVTSTGLTLTDTLVSPTQLRVTGTATAAQLGSLLVFRVANPKPGASSDEGYVRVQSTSTPRHSTSDAFTFLRRATWGPAPADVDKLQRVGKAAWLDEQFALPQSAIPAALEEKSLEWMQEYWFELAITAPDQLRLRVAWALHKIWVVSGVEVDCAEVYIPYLRILMNRAFGNYYDVMKEVTLSAAMGEYLDMLNNKKGDLSRGILPNENYGREIKQLFTLGLFELNPDGTQKLSGGQPVPTYTQEQVMALSRAFTGWTYNDGRAGAPTELQWSFKPGPMEPVQKYHDTGEKTLLRGTVLPAGRTATEDLDAALQNIFQHPNLPPFVSRQLIQQLVKSDPSPAYVGRVAAVFTNNGLGVRGDLKAVVRAILMDTEVTPPATAGGGPPSNFNSGGSTAAPTQPLPLSATGNKMLEPALFVSQIVRGLRATVTDTPFMANLATEMGQKVLYPPSVFSYFSPGYRIGGGTLNAPEFQIYSSATSLVRANFVVRLLAGWFGKDVVFDWAPWTALAKDPVMLTERVNEVYFGGRMTAEMKTVIAQAVSSQPYDKEKAQTALYLALSSPQFMVER